MTSTATGNAARHRRSARRLLHGWTQPVHRDGLALVLSSGLTSVLGLGYWVLAARLVPAEVLGINSVVISTMMLLGGVAQLNLNYVLLRFLPVAGRHSRRLLVLAYLAAAALSALAAAVFAAGAHWWAPELLDRVGRAGLLELLVPAAAVWTVFTLQDFVLTALKRATVVPVENLLFALLKIVLLVLAARWAPVGIAVSWVLATVATVALMTCYVFLRALPRHEAATAEDASPFSMAGIGRFMGAQYAGSVCWEAAVFGIPVVILLMTGAADAAVFGVVWTITFALYLVPSGLGQALVAHLASAPEDVGAARRSMIVKSGVLLVPAVVVLAVAAPLVLAVFGDSYAGGRLALVLAAASALPNIITMAELSVARVQRRTSVLFAVPAGIATITIGLTVVLVPWLGITGAAAAWLTSQTVVASMVLLRRW